MSERLEDIKNMVEAMDGDLIAQLFGNELKGQAVVDDLRWLISQAEKYEKIQRLSKTENMTVMDFAKNSLRIIEDYEVPKRNARK